MSGGNSNTIRELPGRAGGEAGPAYCLPPTAYRLLPTAYRLLPTALRYAQCRYV